ncbi:hypothetical protein GS538_20390 [Rhodococcus hoagii]|nr:hypothetical protein [Prescottella equi]NKS71555.1 hypothetical protein [Prescottella equi]
MSKHSSEDRNVLSYRDTGIRYLAFAQSAGVHSHTRHDGTQRTARAARQSAA